MDNQSYALTINAGSSSIRFDVLKLDGTLARIVGGSVSNIGRPQAVLSVVNSPAGKPVKQQVDVPDHAAAAHMLVDWLGRNLAGGSLGIIGHRIVHGGPKYEQPCLITPAVMNDLEQLIVFDPEHVPAELHLIESLQKLFPGVPQAVCFDTTFHHDLPTEARLLPLPRRYADEGLRRYGFHGLSYTFLLEELRRIDREAADGRLVLAHLGNGVSLAAVHHGKPIDTTMGLTPAGGVPMSSRSGDLDPGVMSYLLRTQALDADGFDRLINFESGLLGLSGSSPDMETLLAHADHDAQAAETISVFCYQVKKAIGSLAAALGGIDQLVFTGGMGEQAPKIRHAVCDGLDFLGIRLDNRHNNENAAVISASHSQATVRVMHTDEARVIAQASAALLEKEAHDK